MTEKLLLFDGDIPTGYYMDIDMDNISYPSLTTAGTWDLSTGSSWSYFVNSGDYKIEDHKDSLAVHILVAGVSKKDIKAYMEGPILTVHTDEIGWNGSVNVTIDLQFYKVDTKNPKIKLSNGVLRVEFPKIDEKINLEIK